MFPKPLHHPQLHRILWAPFLEWQSLGVIVSMALIVSLFHWQELQSCYQENHAEHSGTFLVTYVSRRGPSPGVLRFFCVPLNVNWPNLIETKLTRAWSDHDKGVMQRSPTLRSSPSCPGQNKTLNPEHVYSESRAGLLYWIAPVIASPMIVMATMISCCGISSKIINKKC